MDKNDKKHEQKEQEKLEEKKSLEENTKHGLKGKKSIEELEKKIQELEEKVAEYENNWKRAIADYRNLEKRNLEERLETIKFANRDLLLKLLPAFDTLFLAEKYIEDESLRITVKHVLDVLRAEGIERIKTEGCEFNPEIMEAITTEEGEENKVLQELRPGFMLNGKLLKAAQVKVGKGEESIK